MYYQEHVEYVFDQAIALIEKGFCQYADARNDQGLPCDPMDNAAVEWSIPGAFEKAAIDCGYYEYFYSNGYPGKMIERELWKLIQQTLQLPWENVEAFNNLYALYQHEVIRILKRGKANIPSLNLPVEEGLCRSNSCPMTWDHTHE